jgi:hypothetical protein
MSSFLFFLLLTMLMAFLMNWIYMQYIYSCTDCTHTSKHLAETEKLVRKVGETTETEDMDAFFQ